MSTFLDSKFDLRSLVQEMASDRVEHKYLWKTSEAFGFFPSFIAMTRTLYCDMWHVDQVNGGIGAPFTLGQGIWRGCAMSGMLYPIVIEPMPCQVRKQLMGGKA